ncbi:hypothetical protein KGM_214732 [Danaus plexippus plexippus]|uniref:Uncharacterized protein n=1 Tax=Danaus plexippus plexippus TaxID=278856 RepID=A0A212F973_DANPL|nr:hypothetical protein KGM_214732 [Danaus plexippus plexippus]
MGKDKKKGPKANVFKVAGAKSLKKTKAKAVNLGLKNIKQKVADIDKQFLDLKHKPLPNAKKSEIVLPQKKDKKEVTQKEISATGDDISKMDL